VNATTERILELPGDPQELEVLYRQDPGAFPAPLQRVAPGARVKRAVELPH